MSGHDQPVRHEVLDPVALWLDGHVRRGDLFYLADVVDGLEREGFEFATIQVQRAVYYLQRTMSLVEPDRDGWFRWVGTLEDYDERRGARGNNQRWVLGEGWD